jgi:hypothetical protein
MQIEGDFGAAFCPTTNADSSNNNISPELIDLAIIPFLYFEIMSRIVNAVCTISPSFLISLLQVLYCADLRLHIPAYLPCWLFLLAGSDLPAHCCHADCHW